MDEDDHAALAHHVAHGLALARAIGRVQSLAEICTCASICGADFKICTLKEGTKDTINTYASYRLHVSH